MNVRNVAIIGHGSSGKTSFMEALLFEAGVISRKGSVDQGNTVSDYLPEETRRKISIKTGVVSFSYKDIQWNFLDTPGYPDFIAEVISALEVCENVILLLDATAGVQVDAERYGSMAVEKGRRLIIFMNKCDRENAKYEEWMDEIKEKLGVDPVPLTMPYNGKIIDLIKEEIDHPLRTSTVEAAAETDDALIEKYLSGEKLSADEVKKGLVQAVASGKAAVFAGSALTGEGIPLLFEYLADFASPPEEKEGPVAVRVFKTLTDPYVGRLNYFKVISGTLKGDTHLYNPLKDFTERITHIYKAFGKEIKEVSQLECGDIGVVAKLERTTTGDVLHEPGASVEFEQWKYPEPLLLLAVKPKDKEQEDKLASGLHRLKEEDPTFNYRVDNELKQTLIAGIGDLHLEIALSELKNRFGVEVVTEPPKVPYRETIRKSSDATGKYVKQTGGRGQYGIATIKIEPLNRGEGYEFVNAIVGGAIPSQYIPYVEQGIKKAMEAGVLAGYPVVDVKITLYDGKHHPVDSSNLAFEIAGSLAFKEAQQQAEPYLLEPIYEVEVKVPEEFMGDVIGDLNARRGKILGMEPQGKWQIIRAHVPLAELFRYPVELRSMTQGRGSFTMRFSHYEEVPPKIAEEIIKKAKEEKES